MEKKWLAISSTIFKLIYLLVFVESGLGGLMHLFHIPLTGFIVGGFSILMNILIARYSELNIKTMLSALGLVLMCKFVLSPQTPLGAYVAVSFQGLAAILVFNTFKVNRWSIILYSSITMLENAIQKPLMAYLIFGKELKQGLIMIAHKFFQNPLLAESFLGTLIGIYFFIYLVWAMLVSIWSLEFLNKLSTYQLRNKSFKIESYFESKRVIQPSKKWGVILIATILFVISSYFLVQTHQKVYHYLFRVTVIFVFLGFVLPFGIKKIVSHFKKQNEFIISEILNEIPKIKNNFVNSYHLTSSYKGINRWKEFIFLGIYLSVFYTTDES